MPIRRPEELETRHEPIARIEVGNPFRRLLDAERGLAQTRAQYNEFSHINAIESHVTRGMEGRDYSGGMGRDITSVASPTPPEHFSDPGPRSYPSRTRQRQPAQMASFAAKVGDLLSRRRG